MAKTAMLEATTTETSSNVANNEISKVLQYLAPWIEKTAAKARNELIEKLSQYGKSYQGLCVETYAVCKAYATLKVIALDANWDNESLFQKLLPWFIDEAKEMVDEVKNGENV